MRSAEARAKTVEAAKEDLVGILGVAESLIRFEVLEEPKPGLMGLGGHMALVRGTAVAARAEWVKGYLKGLFQTSGDEAVVVVRQEEDRLQVSVSGEFDWFTGITGESLDALQRVVNSTAQQAEGRGEVEPGDLITIDIGRWRERRYEQLENVALELAAQAKASGEAIPMKPMSASDRRAVHIALRDYPGISTTSEGEEPARRVVVRPLLSDEQASSPERQEMPEGGSEPHE
ncbi:MAG: R3H domain-containing nucleic acid-binding protein [Sulfobacillus sp.]